MCVCVCIAKEFFGWVCARFICHSLENQHDRHAIRLSITPAIFIVTRFDCHIKLAARVWKVFWSNFLAASLLIVHWVWFVFNYAWNWTFSEFLKQFLIHFVSWEALLICWMPIWLIALCAGEFCLFPLSIWFHYYNSVNFFFTCLLIFSFPRPNWTRRIIMAHWMEIDRMKHRLVNNRWSCIVMDAHAGST